MPLPFESATTRSHVRRNLGLLLAEADEFHIIPSREEHGAGLNISTLEDFDDAKEDATMFIQIVFLE